MTDQTPIKTVSHKTIAAALAAAQSEMGKAKKSASNPHFKSKYPDLDSVTDAAMPALNKHGIAVVAPLEKDGDKWLVMTRFIHGESGEVLETPIPLFMSKMDMQGLGSAITYARRYGLMTLSGIAPEDDDGNAAVSVHRNSQQQRDPVPERPRFDPRAAADRIITAVNRHKGDADALGELWIAEKATRLNLPEDLFAEVKSAFQAAAPAPAAPDLGNDTIPY